MKQTRQNTPIMRRLIHLLWLCAAPLALNAQTAPAAAATPPQTEGGSVELTPFTVTTVQDKGYASTNTLSGTRTNEELKNLPNSISILNRQFLDDIAANDFFEAMQYMTSMEAEPGGAAGIGGNSGVQVNVRGIPNNWQSRNGFQWYVPTDTFNTERLEASLGASGQLYGDVGAGGILNVSTKAAQFVNRNSLQVRIDDWGQVRESVDLRRKVSDKWAIRMNAVNSRGGDWRDGPHNDIIAGALANTINLGKNSQLRIDGEWGELNNRVAHNRLAEGYLDYDRVMPLGTTAADVDPVAAGVQANYAYTTTNAVGAPASYDITSIIQTTPGNNQQWRLINGQFYSFESTATLKYRQSVTDATRAVNVPEDLIPREQQWNGPDATADRDYHTIQAFFNHKFSDKLSVELAYNLQVQKNTTWQSNTSAVRRDPNPFLAAPNVQSGTAQVPNPYYNELYIENGWVGSVVTNNVGNYRAMAVYDLELPWGIKQRLVGMTQVRDEMFTAAQKGFTLSPAKIAAAGLTGAPAQLGNNAITERRYLKDGNSDSILARYGGPDMTVATVAGFNARQPQVLYTAALNAFGSMWKDRIRTSVGIRRDKFDKKAVAAVNDPVTGEVTLPGEPLPFAKAWNTALNYGAVVNITPWMSGVYNYSETFIANAAGFLFDGGDIPPQLGNSTEFGLRFSLWEDKVNARATYYESEATNAFTANVVAGTAVNLATVLGEIVNVLGATNTETGRPFTGGGANGRDLQSRKSKGYEFELTANPSPNLTLRAVLTQTKVGIAERAPHLKAVFDRMVAKVAAGGVGVTSGVALSPADYARTETQLATLGDDEPSDVWRPLVSARYSFTSGSLKGSYVGGSAIWNDFQRIDPTYSSGVLTREGYKIDSYTIFNLFAGYARSFGKVRWQAQLNINNALDEDIRLGGYASARYPNPRQFVLTNTFTF